MSWPPERIKTLRQKLGWTRAELSRRVGVTTDVVLKWENGDEKPGVEACNHLASLDGHSQKYSQSLAADPMAEIYLEKNRLNQVLKSDLNNHE